MQTKNKCCSVKNVLADPPRLSSVEGKNFCGSDGSSNLCTKKYVYQQHNFRSPYYSWKHQNRFTATTLTNPFIIVKKNFKCFRTCPENIRRLQKSISGKIHVVLILYSLQEMQIKILSIALTILFISFISAESYHSPLPFMDKPTLVNSNAVVSQD